MKTIDHNALSEIVSHFVNVYKDEIDTVNGDCIHEWWGQVICLYINQLESSGFDLDDNDDLHDIYNQIEKAIFNYIESM